MAALGGFYNSSESFFGAIGGKHPIARFIIGAGITVLFMEAIKPGFAYDGRGGRRPYGSANMQDESIAFSEDGGASLTNIPFWGPPLVVGVAAATLI